MTPIYPSLTAAYSKAIYKDGTKRFHEIRQEYVPHVKQYAASNYTESDIQRALDLEYITRDDFEDTLALRA